MSVADVDRLFAAIRSTRDPELLTALFERTAPWLLHRARLLLGRVNLAEDVVQDLFLGLLENGHGCDPGRPCLPYLLGMLHRRAAHVRRQEARTLAQSLRDATSTAVAPIDTAITGESRAAVRQAIDGLPEPYREVVRRYLAQQSPSSIGRALGRTPNAVRVQLHRGLRLLRASLPPGLLVLLCAVPGQAAPAQVRPYSVMRRSLPFVAAAAAAGVLAVSLATTATPAGAVAAGGAAPSPTLAALAAHVAADANAATGERTVAPAPVVGDVVLELRHADGAPGAGVAVLAHPAGRDPDFGAVAAVSGDDGRVALRGLPAGAVNVQVDRGRRFVCTVAPGSAVAQVVTLDAGLDVAGVVRDAAGRPAAGAGIWLCADGRAPAEGNVVVRAGDDGRFVLRGVPPNAIVGAVRDGSVPSLLQPVASSPAATELVLGGEGARATGHVLGPDGTPVEGAVVRVARHPRAHFQLPRAGNFGPVHPCAVVRTDASGAFAAADLPPGPMQVLVRAPGCRGELASIVLTAGTEHRCDVRLRAGRDLDGAVQDPDGRPLADVTVLARGLVRSAWASTCTAPDGSFALAGLGRDHVVLELHAPGFAPRSLPLARDAGRVVVVLQPETSVVLRLRDATGATARPAEWELAACVSRPAGTVLEPLDAAGDGYVASGERARGPFVVRRVGGPVWLRAEPAGGEPDVWCVPAAAATPVPLVLSLPATTPEQRGALVLVLERDGVSQSLAAADPAPVLLDFGRVPAGAYCATLYSRGGLSAAQDLGVVDVVANGEPLVVAQPAQGWLRFRLQRTDREPVLQCATLAVDERGFRIPLPGAGGRVALAAGRYQLWASSLSFPSLGHAFAVTAGQETVLDVDVSPGAVRHVAFALPPDVDLQRCRARVRSAGDGEAAAGADFPLAERGFDTTADGGCFTTLVLAAGEYRLDVQCGERRWRARFVVAGEAGVAEPIDVELSELR